MDRQPHDYSAMAFAQQQQQVANIQQQQQQQQFGFPPQHQQFPPSVHGPPFMPPHPSMQPYPFHHMQQGQLHPHPPHPHLLHLQQQQQLPPSFPPHLPPHIVPSPFRGSYDSPPPAPPPSDPELQKCIDKLVEYAAKHGPEFEAMVRENQKDNPAYSFLFGGDGHNYYRYTLWLATRPPGGPFNPPFPSSSIPVMHPPNPMVSPSPPNVTKLNASGVGSGTSPSLLNAPQLHQPPFPPFYEQQHPQPFLGNMGGPGRPHYDQSSGTFKGLSGPLPSDVAMELNNVLNGLTGTKESIKGAKLWFMQRSPFAPALAEALRDRVFAVDDSERQLHILFLSNDILFDSLQRRTNTHDISNEALAFRPVLGSMLARIYHNPQNKEENQERLQKVLQFWASKEVYDRETIHLLESEMIGLPTNSFAGHQQRDFSSVPADPSTFAGLPHQASNHNALHWQSDKQNFSDQEHLEKQVPSLSAIPQQFLLNSSPAGGFPGAIPMMSSSQPTNLQSAPHLLPAQTSNIGEKLPPYPLFPPGLIPGMVRKMQIGSGVPYSPMSPLDIPTMIPPSTTSPSELLERVSKFFREIGEVNPSEGPLNSADDDDEYERDSPVRKGGTCIPPPPNLQVDPETGTLPDGSVERKPGSVSSGRLGLGATANPNEVSQYDDVYSSYRKQRSTNYHTSMSARSATATTR